MRRERRERFPLHRLNRKPLDSDPGMHHGTFVTHHTWCVSGSLTSGGRENFRGIPGACATRNCTYLANGSLEIRLWKPIYGSRKKDYKNIIYLLILFFITNEKIQTMNIQSAFRKLMPWCFLSCAPAVFRLEAFKDVYVVTEWNSMMLTNQGHSVDTCVWGR